MSSPLPDNPDLVLEQTPDAPNSPTDLEWLRAERQHRSTTGPRRTPRAHQKRHTPKHRRTSHATAPRPRPAPAPGSPEAQLRTAAPPLQQTTATGPRADLDTFAALVYALGAAVGDAGRPVPERILIYALWQQAQKSGQARATGGSLKRFRTLLVRAHQTGRLVLVRATQADGLTERQRAPSETRGKGGDVYHFLKVGLRLDDLEHTQLEEIDLLSNA